MTQLNWFDRQALPGTPWKNGGGLTREVVCQPPSGGLQGFDWRVSIATIAASGPFSVFEGVDRVITLLDGAGVTLRVDGAEQALAVPLEPYAFAGEALVDCTLRGGVSTDFNVMANRRRARAEVRVLRQAEHFAALRHGVLLAAAGHWSAMASSGADAEPRALEAGQGVWWSDYPTQWRLQPCGADAALLLVSVVLLQEET